MVADLNAQANRVAPVIQVNLSANLPALVLAQQLYGDARRADELIMRNDPANLGFTQTTIEALA